MARPFIEAGIRISGWRSSCDARGQRAVTLRVSALAALAAVGIAQGWGSVGAAPTAPVSLASTAPEFVVRKAEDRVSSSAMADENGANPLRRRPFTPAHASSTTSAATETTASFAAPAMAAIEVENGITLKSGTMTVQIADLVPPDSARQCRRLDGLTVPCIDRLHSYVQLIVRGRSVGCHHVGTSEAGRDLGRCQIGEADVAEQIIRQGWAGAAKGADQRLVLAEAAARRQKLGMWQ